MVWTTLGTSFGRCHNWVGIPGRPAYVIPRGSAGWKKVFLWTLYFIRFHSIFRRVPNPQIPDRYWGEINFSQKIGDAFGTFFHCSAQQDNRYMFPSLSWKRKLFWARRQPKSLRFCKKKSWITLLCAMQNWQVKKYRSLHSNGKTTTQLRAQATL